MIKIEMISVCDRDGRLTPLRFRMEDESCGLQTVVIRRVVDIKLLKFGGMDVIQYLCKASQAEQDRLLELRYIVRTHCWNLSRVLY